MPIPKPTKDQTENEYISTCIAFLVGEGKDKEDITKERYFDLTNDELAMLMRPKSER